MQLTQKGARPMLSNLYNKIVANDIPRSNTFERLIKNVFKKAERAHTLMNRTCIIKYKNLVSPISEMNEKLRQQYNISKFEVKKIYSHGAQVVEFGENDNVEELLKRLASDPQVEYIEQVKEVKACTENSKSSSS